MTAPSEARLRDPAHRDQDGLAWRRGRFAERVRRQWNALEGAPLDPADLAGLAEAIRARVGGDVAAIRARLEEFARMDEEASPAADDLLVRPGADAA